MTVAAKQCREYVVAQYPGVRISRLSCRLTASGKVTQHSAYGGKSTYDSNAIDIMGGPMGWSWDDNVELIQQIVDDLTPHLGDWSIRKILWQTAYHYGHAHIDFWPMIVTPLKWCGGPETPTWRLPDRTTIKTRNPDPVNGLYVDPDTSKEDFMKLGDSGINVTKWQEYLNRWIRTYNLKRAPIKEDGVYGPITVDRTVEFQRWANIEPSGQFGNFEALTMGIVIEADKGE